MDIAIIADDLTGAADSGIQFARAGYRTAVTFHGAPLPPAEELDATVVDTDSRLLSSREARERVQDAGEALRDARLVYKKIDSTLRGPLAAELEAALEATGRSRAIVAPAFPSTGRSTVEGVQLLHGKPVHETGLANDPHTPVKEGHIPAILAEAGFEGVFMLSAEDLKDPGKVRQVLGEARWVVADAGEDSHLEALVRAVPNPTEVLWTGSAGLAGALGKVYPGPRAGDAAHAPARPVRRVLAVVGSTNEVARKQLERLVSEPDVVSVALDSHAVSGSGARGCSEAAVRDALGGARRALSEGKNAVLYTTVADSLEGDDARRLVDAVAEVVAGLSEEGLFDALVLTGGDTAVHVGRALGARGILLEEEIAAGVPVGTLIGPEPYRVVTKAGGFGGPETLLDALRTLTGKE